MMKRIWDCKEGGNKKRIHNVKRLSFMFQYKSIKTEISFKLEKLSDREY